MVILCILLFDYNSNYNEAVHIIFSIFNFNYKNTKTMFFRIIFSKNDLFLLEGR